MRYGLDLSIISLDAYKTLLKGQNLLPGRRMLLEHIDERFAALIAQRIDSLDQLRRQLAAPNSRAALSEAAGIPEEYLILLKREMGALEPKSVPLSDFPWIDARLILKLAGNGVRNSRSCFETGCPQSEELASLCDMVRINGVGALAAKTFYEAGYRSVADVASADAPAMLRRITAVDRKSVV